MRATLSLVLALVLPVTAAACDDANAWRRLEQLRDERVDQPNGKHFAFLYNLRKFVCDEIAAGRLPHAEGDRMFEMQRERIIRQIRDSNPREEAPA